MQHTLPCGPGRNLSTIRVDGVPVELTASSVNIHLVCAQPATSLPEVADDPEEEDDGKGEVQLEEALSSVRAGLADRSSNGGVELQENKVSVTTSLIASNHWWKNIPER